MNRARWILPLALLSAAALAATNGVVEAPGTLLQPDGGLGPEAAGGYLEPAAPRSVAPHGWRPARPAWARPEPTSPLARRASDFGDYVPASGLRLRR